MHGSDEQLATDVREEIFWDGRVPPRQVAVRVRDGVVTLRGTVGSRPQRSAATEAAMRVDGVAGVENELQVQLQDLQLRRDAELRAEVLQTLDDAGALIPETVDAKAQDGVVILTGTVTEPFQRHEAEALARGVRGVRDVWNELLLDRAAPAASATVTEEGGGE